LFFTTISSSFTYTLSLHDALPISLIIFSYFNVSIRNKRVNVNLLAKNLCLICFLLTCYCFLIIKNSLLDVQKMYKLYIIKDFAASLFCFPISLYFFARLK